MPLFTSSSGLLAKKTFIEAALAVPLRPLAHYRPRTALNSAIFVGWGLKANTTLPRQQAARTGRPYWCLEDGFIGYAGHPARAGVPLSLVCDDLGVYYDARQPSRLEQLIAEPCDGALLQRAEALIARLVAEGVTKYNCYSDRTLPLDLQRQLHQDERPCVLIVDQVSGDCSIDGALACEEDFVRMLAMARAKFPDARLLLRTHPDSRFGSKTGVLAKRQLPDVEIIDAPCHPHALLEQVEAVFTVSSQLGFEALLLGKPVFCFGMPFYAGWGLTQDAKQCPRRTARVSLPQLVAAALIRYPRYVDPVLQQRCEVEQTLDLLRLQQRPAPRWETLYLVGFSWWKRAFIAAFCGHLAQRLCYRRQPPATLEGNEQVLVWGNQFADYPWALRLEDGFIRSRGLGSDLCRPSSLAIDDLGIYFDARRPSRLEQLLNHHEYSAAELQRGEALLERLQALRISKYNVGGQQGWLPPETCRQRILVVGQVEGDASLLAGSPLLQSNAALLQAVRKAYPHVHLIYKPHPDVLAGNRPGVVPDETLKQCVDTLVCDVSLQQILPHVSALHTMTSLSGFEALIQGVPVVTWGQPFYAGWGLTEDRMPPARRGRRLTLPMLVHAALVLYPEYHDWRTGLRICVEQQIALLAQENHVSATGMARPHRWLRKLSYLSQTLFAKRQAQYVR